MSRTILKSILVVLMTAALFAAAPITALGEEAKVTKKPLMKQDMSIDGRLAVMVDVQLDPGTEEGRHSHPAELYVYVREGELTLECEGRETQTYKAGEVFNVGPGQVHNGMNKGDTTTKLLAVLVAEKGKPLSSPAE